MDAESPRTVPPTIKVWIPAASSSSTATLTPLVRICRLCLFLILRAISNVVVPESRMIVSPSLMSAAAIAPMRRFSFGVRSQALAHGRFAKNGVGAHCAAVRTLQQPPQVEFIQIVPDSHCRCAKSIFQLIDLDPSLRVKDLQDLRPTFLRHHSVELRRCVVCERSALRGRLSCLARGFDFRILGLICLSFSSGLSARRTNTSIGQIRDNERNTTDLGNGSSLPVETCL